MGLGAAPAMTQALCCAWLLQRPRNGVRIFIKLTGEGLVGALAGHFDERLF